jgi:hypothetical protein
MFGRANSGVRGGSNSLVPFGILEKGNTNSKRAR